MQQKPPEDAVLSFQPSSILPIAVYLSFAQNTQILGPALPKSSAIINTAQAFSKPPVIVSFVESELSYLIQDHSLQKAVSSIPLRSEGEQDKGKLIQSFVDTGILVQLSNPNNQVFYGRRGTGKTHVLQVLAQKVTEGTNSVAIYVDFRTLGSNTQNDPERQSMHNATLLFKDLLAEIHAQLLRRASSDVCEVSKSGFDALDDLAKVATKVASIRIDTRGVEREKYSDETGKAAEIKATLSSKPSLSAEAKINGKRVTESEQTVNYDIIEKHYLIFNEVRSVLEKAIVGQQIDKLYILLDEWSSTSTASQPYLADYIKRCLLTNNRIVVKIASLEYRSVFSIGTGQNNVLGFELGADISAALDIDDYCVFDRNSKGVTETFEILLYKHIITELPDQHLEKVHEVLHQGDFINSLFSARKTFIELVRSAEGVARDFINIFAKAFYDSLRRDRSKIDISAVTESARQWYEQDKQPQLDPVQRNVLSKIIGVVIGEKKARSFMVERDVSTNTTIRSLFDFRVIHLIQRGYADKANPGLRYNIYTLDYGTYVDLLKTNKPPELEFKEVEPWEEDFDRIVPFDDKRSIRRIILTAEQIKSWTATE